MDFTPKPTTSTTPITPQIAQAIYELIKTHGNADLAFKNQAGSLYDAENVKATADEFDRIVAELTAYRNGSVVVTPAVPAVVDDEGNITTPAVPAVYYEYTTDADLISQVSSELLDVADVWADIKEVITISEE